MWGKVCAWHGMALLKYGEGLLFFKRKIVLTNTVATTNGATLICHHGDLVTHGCCHSITRSQFSSSHYSVQFSWDDKRAFKARRPGVKSHLFNLGKLLNLSVSTSANWRFPYLPSRVYMCLSCQGDPATLGPHHYSDPIFFHSLLSHSALSTLTPMFSKQTRQSLNVESSDPSKENERNWFIPRWSRETSFLPGACCPWSLRSVNLWEVYCRHAHVSFL